MFPLNWNIPFIRKNGSRTTLGAITGDIAGIEEDVEGLETQTSALWDTIGQNGAKNRISVNLDDAKEANTAKQPDKGSWSGDTWTFAGLSHRVNDGEITISGTQTGSPVSFYFSDSSTWGLVDGETYVITFNPSGTLNANHYYERMILTKDGAAESEVDVADGSLSFTYDSNSVYSLGVINRAANVSHNYAIKPMLRLASDTDPTYQPYAMTNRELTEDKLSLSVLKTAVADSSDFADFKTKVAAL